LNGAVQRSGIGNERLYRLFPNWGAWLNGEKQPTLKQIEDIARATHTPVGFFYLPKPVNLEIPIPDFRKISSSERKTPSPDLLDVIHIAQLRQSWYRDHAKSEGMLALPFVGSVTTRDDPNAVAAQIRASLTLSAGDSAALRSFSDMVRMLREKVEAAGVMVFISGIVGSNTHRTLDPTEFRGFAISDEYAPIVFVNGGDTKAAQIFTLIHEYVHIWLGSTALSDADLVNSENAIETWCNKVSAEVLVPLKALSDQYEPEVEFHEEMLQLARYFKVSTLVIIHRLFDAGLLNEHTYHSVYDEEFDRLLNIEPKQLGSGGDFYNNTLMRTGHRFAMAVLSSAWEGKTSFTDAMRMLGIKNIQTLRSMSQRLAVYG